MNEEEPKKLFSYRNPLYNKPSAPPPKISDPILPIPCKGQAAGGEGSQGGDPSGSGGVLPSRADNPPLDHSQGDPSMEKVSEQQTSSQEAAKPIRNVLCPSRLPRRGLKYMDDKRTILDPAGHPIGSLRFTDVVKSKRSSTSEVAKHKEPDTPDLGSRGALAPIQKQVKFEGVTFHHGLTPSIHMGASLHDVEEKDKDNNGEEGENDEDDDNTPEDTPRDNVKEGEDKDDEIQVIETDPVPSKHWTQSQQAQQDEKESSLVKEILSDDEKLQKSREEVEKASKEKVSAPSSSDQQSSLGEGSGSVSKEFDHQEPEKEEGEELAVKEVLFARLNTKDKVLMKALSKAWDLCYQQDNLSVQYVQGAIMNISSTRTAAQIHGQKLFRLGPPENRVVDDIHSHWVSYLYDFRSLANAPYSQFRPKEGWDAVYTWESLGKHESTFTNSFGKKASKPSLIVVVAPTTTRDRR